MKKKLIKISILILFISLIITISHLAIILGFELMPFEGTSMCPDYGKSGYGLHKAVTSADDLEIGNVYLFEYSGADYNYVEHRLIEITNDYYIFKGDNNYWTESVSFDKIKYENIIHIVFEGC